ncbi:hypothetical protein [uncultured Tenacibaculum sp.]|uniref:hypothetical protein n=1 Tax=uncultured Tenacibaculum sp. TaxID=174713 RepID=UPI00262A6CE8|nr:hypothetical protein [uncultured Tenacibaculum sp.]
MIEQLIKKTNTTDFYQNGHFHLTELKGRIGYFKTMEFNFILEERDNYGNISKVEYWRLITHNTIKFRKLFSEQYLPYIKLRILDEHPLLWTFHKNELECELQGFPNNPSQFIGDLYFAYEQNSGNWIELNKHFFNVREHFKNNRKMNLRIPEPLAKPIREVCEKHEIGFKVENVIKDYKKGYAYRPNAKLLIFGNEDVSSNYFNLGQPYIIGDEFIANKK